MQVLPEASRARVLSLDGDRYEKVDGVVPLNNCEVEVRRLGQLLVERGGRELVEEAVEKLSGT